jgi:thiol-disulfide isomerase/thioredoxin
MIRCLLLLACCTFLMAEEPNLQRITMADGRVLEGVLDENAGTFQLYNIKTGKPLAVLQIKVADIKTREAITIAKVADEEGKADDPEAKPKAKRGADGRFLTNHAAALKLAKELNRPVFAFFTGSDWCPHCQRAQKDVLTTPVFRAWAETHVVLLELDYPNKPLPKALKEQNEALKRQYGISSYPNFHLLNPEDGKSYGNFSGLPQGGPEVFIDELIRRIPNAKLSK